jgi:hypothetical protein
VVWAPASVGKAEIPIAANTALIANFPNCIIFVSPSRLEFSGMQYQY